MGLNDTPVSERVHIAFFGCRNAGKSSLVNAVTGQTVSVVSDVKGTTTDPVKKTMELLPIGPVVIIDTPGIDDEGNLGELRVERTKDILRQTDVAVLVCDSTVGMSEADSELLKYFADNKVPYVIAMNKSDLIDSAEAKSENTVFVSAINGSGINELKEKIASFAKKNTEEKHIISHLISHGDVVVLVIPIDESAPKGRLILPQQQTLREILDSSCTAICCQPDELKGTLAALSVKPKLVVTDSQVFGKVSKDVPEDILLTSFSILFAGYKGDLETLVGGAAKLSKLKSGDKVLISEGCTHHRQCNDIGTVKMPGWIRNFTGVEPEFEFTSGGQFPGDLSKYALIVHCGGCMLNEKEMMSRIEMAKSAGVPIVNYGVAIAHMHGILCRSLEAFPGALCILAN